jgi:uncharacterized protein
MSIQQGCNIIDFIVSNNPLTKHFDVTFFGGEPLLMYPTMRGIVEAIEQKYPSVTFEYNITTNGTLLSDEIIEFLKRYKFRLLVSFDGPDKISNNRPYGDGSSSTETVLNNIQKMHSESIPITIRATIASNTTQILSIFQFLESLKIPFAFSFAYNSVNREHHLSDYSTEALQCIDKQLDDLAMYYYNLIYNDQTVYCQTIKEWLANIHFKILSNIACAAGFSSYTFNADGSIFTCQHFANNNNDACGTIQSGINEKKLSKLRAPLVENLIACTACWCRYLCGGCCFAEKYAQNGSITEKIPEKCELEQIKWEKILSLAQRIADNKSEYFTILKQHYENI